MHTTNGETSQNLVAEREVSEGVRQVVRREERLVNYHLLKPVACNYP